MEEVLKDRRDLSSSPTSAVDGASTVVEVEERSRERVVLDGDGLEGGQVAQLDGERGELVVVEVKLLELGELGEVGREGGEAVGGQVEGVEVLDEERVVEQLEGDGVEGEAVEVETTGATGVDDDGTVDAVSGHGGGREGVVERREREKGERCGEKCG